MTLKILDLCSGIGGFSLGLERAGMETIAFCEIDQFCRKILKKHWPDVPIFEDVRKLHAADLPETVDLVCAGFPCQPFSVAGKQRGKEDDRYLWPEIIRIVREFSPDWCIFENVPGLLAVDNGMAFDTVLSDLENEGYEVWPFIIPACAVNAPHRRDRVWIVAHAECERTRNKGRKISDEERRTCKNREKMLRQIYRPSCANWSKSTNKDVADTCGTGRQKCDVATKPGDKGYFAGGSDLSGIVADSMLQQWDGRGKWPCRGQREQGKTVQNVRGKVWKEIREWPTEPPVCNTDDGVSDRVARLKVLGNAVVPQIPEMMGRAILDAA